MLTDVQKNQPVPCDDIYPSYHRYPQPILVFLKKFSRKAAIRPIVPIDAPSLCAYNSFSGIMPING